MERDYFVFQQRQKRICSKKKQKTKTPQNKLKHCQVFENLSALTVMARPKVLTGRVNVTISVSLYSSEKKLFTLKSPSQKVESRTERCWKMTNAGGSEGRHLY